MVGGWQEDFQMERKKRGKNFNKPFIFAEMSIMSLNFNGNYTIVPSVIFVYVFLCPFIIVVLT